MNSEQFFSWCDRNRSFVPHIQARSSPVFWEHGQDARCLVMGVLNVTPDSFSDAGQYQNPEVAVQRALVMIAEGVDLIDIGGESSRPGAVPISVAEELARVIPVIEGIRAVSDVCISIDTCKVEVMIAAVEKGVSLINDINALQADGALSAIANQDVRVCLMHMRGSPATMQLNLDHSGDMIGEINQFFQQRIIACEKAGISRQRLILDPGFGFGKTVEQNLMLVKYLAEFRLHGLPILLGVSKKSTLGHVLNQPVEKRMPGGLAAAIYAILQGANIIRTHDVFETSQAIQMINAIVHM